MATTDTSTLIQNAKEAVGLFDASDFDIFNNRYRFGFFNTFAPLYNTKEFLFFTKPNLNIILQDDSSGAVYADAELNPALAKIPYWIELQSKYSDVIACLESAYTSYSADPFNQLLANMCISNLSVPGLSAELVETPVNTFGIGYSYRGSSEASNDNFEFDLEFKDTKYLQVYQFFKAYDEYETLKHHGLIRPSKYYILNRILHDQFSIYKFLVDEDMETIIYYAKFIGVTPTNIPRDVFSNTQFDGGISYSISFKSAFFEDMDPRILVDFNKISKSYYDKQSSEISVFNSSTGTSLFAPAKAAYITRVTASDSSSTSGADLRALQQPGTGSSKFLYKLVWKGDNS